MWMMPAMSCAKERVTANDTLRSSALKTISSSMQVTVTFLEFPVQIRREKRRTDVICKKEGGFARIWKNASGLQRPNALCSEFLST